MTKTLQNFISLPIFADEWQFGGVTELNDEEVNGTGDWRKYATIFEPQKRQIETSACVTYANLNAIEILHQHQYGSLPDYSERYTATLSGTTEQGNNPQRVLETIRKHGVIPESQLPFTDDIKLWDTYYEPVSPELKRTGKRWTKSYTLKHDWVITPKTQKAEKTERLKDALRYSPLPIAVSNWWEQGGVYQRAGGDCHMCLLIGYDKNAWYVLDTYAPFIKRLSFDYEFHYAKRISLTKRRGLLSFLNL